MNEVRLSTGYTLRDALAFGLAGMLGVKPEHAADLLAKASTAAKANECQGCDECNPEQCTHRADDDPPLMEWASCETCEHGDGFHATRVKVEHPGLAGIWDLRCAVETHVATNWFPNGCAELSRNDLRILLRFESDAHGGHPGDWTAIYKVWRGPEYDPDAEDLH